jgi:hypothetical protein
MFGLVLGWMGAWGFFGEVAYMDRKGGVEWGLKETERIGSEVK